MPAIIIQVLRTFWVSGVEEKEMPKTRWPGNRFESTARLTPRLSIEVGVWGSSVVHDMKLRKKKKETHQ